MWDHTKPRCLTCADAHVLGLPIRVLHRMAATRKGSGRATASELGQRGPERPRARWHPSPVTGCRRCVRRTAPVRLDRLCIHMQDNRSLPRWEIANVDPYDLADKPAQWEQAVKRRKAHRSVASMGREYSPADFKSLAVRATAGHNMLWSEHLTVPYLVGLRSLQAFHFAKSAGVSRSTYLGRIRSRLSPQVQQ